MGAAPESVHPLRASAAAASTPRAARVFFIDGPLVGWIGRIVNARRRGAGAVDMAIVRQASAIVKVFVTSVTLSMKNGYGVP
ncbi:hypothetical protein GCM10009532_07140 [Microbacterium aurantiacum]